MYKTMKRLGALVFAGVLALTGCSTEDGQPGSNGSDGSDGSDGLPGFSTWGGLKIDVVDVTVNADNTVSVHFTMKDEHDYPVDKDGDYSINTAFSPRFGLAYIEKDANDKVLPYVVLTKTTSPTVFNPADGAARGVLVENGTYLGDYTYTFPTSAALDPTKLGNTHTIWIQASRQTDADDRATITPVNLEYNFIPSGSGTVVAREIVSDSGCSKCHNGFKKYTLESGFHGGGRVDANFCGVCHNPARTSGRDESLIPAADAGRFVHRVHYGEHLNRVQTTGTSTIGSQGTNSCSTSSPCTCTVAAPCQPTVFHGINEVTYPQDFRNCGVCHDGAAQGAQWNTRPNRAACGSCHDYVNFVDGAMTVCNDIAADKAAGCRHSGGPQATDAACASCHTASIVQGYHVPVVPPDPNSSLAQATITTGTVTSGSQPGNTTQVGKSCSSSSSCTCTVAAPCAPNTASSNTNSAWVAAAGAVPAGADVITYDMSATGAVSLNGSGNPVIKFKLKRNGTDVVFDAASYGTGVDKELMADFAGSPSVYAVFALPQDGIQTPADFNGSASAYIRNVWNGSATNATIDPDVDTSGYYTITLTGTTLPIDGSVKLLTGGVGYSYSLTSTQPLTQTNLADYPFNVTTRVGGLVVPAANVSKAANATDARRAVVDNAKCKACHAALGVAPTFHGGQRNDGPTCSFCHTPNRTSSGWAANVSTFIHAIHATDKRSAPFNWHAACPSGSSYDATDNRCEDGSGNAVTPSPWYPAIAFPGHIGDCQTCHLPGTYDFTATAAAFPNLLWSTVATGSSAFSASISLSPYVQTGVVYGSGYSINSAGVITEAANTTLVTSPITAACISCHDTDADRYHMLGNGGAFYAPRSSVKPAGKLVNTEQCLICHGKGKIADIAKVHE